MLTLKVSDSFIPSGFYWILQDGRGKDIATSSEAYTLATNCRRAFHKMAQDISAGNYEVENKRWLDHKKKRGINE